jgi:hypothetical protein
MLGIEFKDHFVSSEIGHSDTITCVLDTVPYNIFGMKDVGYMKMFMSTYGTLEQKGKEARWFVMSQGTTENWSSSILM